MKPNLVLLHGWGINSRIWDPVLPALLESFEVTTVDLPGYGSMVNEQPGEDLAKIADAVVSRTPKSAIWCGWSLGGMVAMVAAMKHPERIKRLVLVCSTPKFVQGDCWDCGSSELAMQNLSEQFEQDYSKALARFFLLQLGATPDARKRSRELTRAILQEPNPSWSSLEQGLNLLRATDLRESITNINCPTEVIVGTEDRVIPAEAGRFVAQAIPNARLHEVDAGHIPFLTSSDWFVDRVKQVSGVNI